MIDKGQWREFGQDTGVTPLLFTRSAMGFLMTTESQDLGLTSHLKDGACWQYSVPVTTGVLGATQTTGWAPPAGLTNTSSSSNLVFPGGLPSRYWPAQPCLASVGNQSWAAGWYGCDTQTHMTRGVFSVCVSIHEDMNTCTSSPELLWESLHQLHAVSVEKNYHQIHAETKTERPSWQTAKIKARFNFCIDYIYYIFDFCNIFWPIILLY